MTTETIEKRIEGIGTFQEIVGKFIKRLGDPSQYEFRGEVIDLGEYGGENAHATTRFATCS